MAIDNRKPKEKIKEEIKEVVKDTPKEEETPVETPEEEEIKETPKKKAIETLNQEPAEEFILVLYCPPSFSSCLYSAKALSQVMEGQVLKCENNPIIYLQIEDEKRQSVIDRCMSEANSGSAQRNSRLAERERLCRQS